MPSKSRKLNSKKQSRKRTIQRKVLKSISKSSKRLGDLVKKSVSTGRYTPVSTKTYQNFMRVQARRA